MGSGISVWALGLKGLRLVGLAAWRFRWSKRLGFKV